MRDLLRNSEYLSYEWGVFNDFKNGNFFQILGFVSEITIYLNGSNNELLNCAYIKQTIYPLSGNKVISSTKLLNYFKEIQFYNLVNINIVSKIDVIDGYKDLLDFFILNKYNINFYFKNDLKLYSNNILSRLTSVGQVNIISLPEEVINEFNYNYNYIFFIRNINDLVLIESYDFKEKNIEIIPIFDKSNQDFFTSNVFIKTSELKNSYNTKNSVFANEIINTNFFGKLIILPNGNIFTSFNCKSIGNLKSPIQDIIFKAMYKANGWLSTRNIFFPCNECRYKNLCPPISNYEFFMNKFNLCDKSFNNLCRRK